MDEVQEVEGKGAPSRTWPSQRTLTLKFCNIYLKLRLQLSPAPPGANLTANLAGGIVRAAIEQAYGIVGGAVAFEILDFRSDSSTALLRCDKKWLQYEVPGGRPEHEEGYVTVIRYSSHAPQGKATCLLNWRTGGIEGWSRELDDLSVSCQPDTAPSHVEPDMASWS
eukprot:jgi/Mesen1/7669/ME000401S07007